MAGNIRFVETIEDSKMWQNQFEDSLKGKNKMHGEYFILNQTGRGEGTTYIPSVAQDIIIAKSKVRKYKKRVKRVNNQTKRKSQTGRKVKTKKVTKRRKTQKSCTKRRR